LNAKEEPSWTLTIVMAWTSSSAPPASSDTLKSGLGAMARRFQSEDERLQGVRAHRKEIADDPAEYLGALDLENEESVTATMIGICAAERCSRVGKILAMPMNERGARQW